MRIHHAMPCVTPGKVRFCVYLFVYKAGRMVCAGKRRVFFLHRLLAGTEVENEWARWVGGQDEDGTKYSREWHTRMQSCCKGGCHGCAMWWE